MLLVLVHFAAQALSASSTHPASRWHESVPWVTLVTPLWLLALAHAAECARGRQAPSPSSPREHTLAVAERWACLLLVAFGSWHGIPLSWRSLSGTLAPSDLRPHALALLSSTTLGMPLTAAAYLCGVGCASFVLSRFARRELGSLPVRTSIQRRLPMIAGLCACGLGVYAVLRFATGTFLPW